MPSAVKHLRRRDSPVPRADINTRPYWFPTPYIVLRASLMLATLFIIPILHKLGNDLKNPVPVVEARSAKKRGCVRIQLIRTEGDSRLYSIDRHVRQIRHTFQTLLAKQQPRPTLSCCCKPTVADANAEAKRKLMVLSIPVG